MNNGKKLWGIMAEGVYEAKEISSFYDEGSKELAYFVCSDNAVNIQFSRILKDDKSIISSKNYILGISN